MRFKDDTDAKTGLVRLWDTADKKAWIGSAASAREILDHPKNEGRFILGSEHQKDVDAADTLKRIEKLPGPTKEEVIALMQQIVVEGDPAKLENGRPTRAAISAVLGYLMDEAGYQEALLLI